MERPAPERKTNGIFQPRSRVFALRNPRPEATNGQLVCRNEVAYFFKR